MVPIRNEHGVVIAFGGRSLDDNSDSADSNSVSEKDGMNNDNHDGSDISESKPDSDSSDNSKYQSFSPAKLAQLAAAAAGNGRGRYTVPLGSNLRGISGSRGSYQTQPKAVVKLAKYLNSPESTIFKKGNTLFGMDLAKKHINKEKEAILVEGYFDVIALHDIGVETAVGTYGMAIFNPNSNTNPSPNHNPNHNPNHDPNPNRNTNTNPNTNTNTNHNTNPNPNP
jgi:hypothetical protein